jgi:hypothetical protein
MIRIACALTLVTLSLAAAGANGEENLQPFTHLARIPAGSDTSSIRFQKAKIVQIPTTIAYTTNPEYCKELTFRGPSASMFCPSARPVNSVTAYEITFSVVGPPLASDEYGNTTFSFDVYFRPDELAPDVRQAISNGKPSRSDVAGSFQVSTSREFVQKIVIDEAESHLCPGNYMDGSWTISDANCKDQVHYKAIAAPSDYTTVRIDLSPIRAGLASGNKAATAIAANK